LIKIAHVITDTNIGGAGRILLTYLNRRNKSDFDVSVVVPEGSLLIPELAKTGVKLYRIQNIADRSFNIRAVSALRKIFAEMKPDIVHTHAALSARIAAKLYGKCKIIHTRHSVFDQKPSSKRFPKKQLLGFINNFFSHAIIAVSPAAKANIVETGTDPNKVHVIYNGVEPLTPLTDEEYALELARWGYEPNDFICAIIGRLVPEKGHCYVLDAAAMLLHSHPQIRFMIVGEGDGLNDLIMEAEADGLTNVLFTGFIQDINRIHGIADVLLNASYGTDATSLSLIEGMSLGVPIVASDFGGNPHVVMDGVTGILFPRRNGGALCAAIQKLYEDYALYCDMCRMAYDRYGERFTAQVMALETENIYRKLTNDSDIG
jgi:glycosyltransferase involved in cell wall biosynthesis